MIAFAFISSVEQEEKSNYFNYFKNNIFLFQIDEFILIFTIL